MGSWIILLSNDITPCQLSGPVEEIKKKTFLLYVQENSSHKNCFFEGRVKYRIFILIYEGRTKSHEQHFFACELGTADEGECGGRWN